MEDKMEWSANGQVLYLDEKGYGLTGALQTVCLGKKEDIIKEHPIEATKRWRGR